MIIYEGKELVLHYHKGDTDYIIISFMGVGYKNEAKTEYFLRNIVEQKNISCLGVTTKEYNYYIHPDIEKIIELCNKITKKYQKIILVGLSMAGYAVLKYSKRLKADTVFAMAPRVTLNEEDCPLPGFVKSVAAGKSLDTIKQSTIGKNDLGGKIYIAYDPLSPVWEYDKEHTEFVYNINPQVIKIPTFFFQGTS